MRRSGYFSAAWLAAWLAALLVAARAWSAAAPALPPLSLPAPLAGNAAVAGSAQGGVLLAAAERAQDLGLPALAADLYRERLDAPGADRAAVGLALATALLDAGRAAEAEPVLEAIPEPRTAAWRLRAGLAALLLRKRAEAQAHWDAIKADELTEADQPWQAFFTGALYDTATPRDERRANQFYVQAERSAPNEIARARFQLAGELVRLRLFKRPSDADLKQAGENTKLFSGQPIGYALERSYAVLLAAAGRTADAVAGLQRALVAIPAQDRATRDEMRFMLGLIGDRGRGGAGRNALMQILENRQKPERESEATKLLERQRQALQLLAEASRTDRGREEFLRDLDRFIAARPAHAILENLWFTRAQFALGDKDYARAEADAGALLKQFPLSPLRLHALGVLTQAAWEQQRYRLAADYARRARTEAAGGAPGVMSARLRADLWVLEAEASFRSEDFRNAADAFAAVLRDRPPELPPQRVSELMFQRVLAEIRSGSGEAPGVLDELARDPAFEVVGRWQAEWSLARALQLQGAAGAKAAYDRVRTLLAAPEPEALPPELRARMMWLHAQLAYHNAADEEAARLVDVLMAAPLDVAPALKAEIASDALRLKARAELALGREPAALETLKRLRTEHPKTEAAISSYLNEAEHYAAQDKIGDARRVLIALTDNPDTDYRNSPYAQYALFRLALLSERLGSEENLREANRRIEELIEISGRAGADQDLIFEARLKQGEIFSKRNDFPAAQRAYEYLVSHYARRPDVVYAQLALAKTHNAQSASDQDRTHTTAARLRFEQLRDRIDAPLDVRVEAGYNLGALLARDGKLADAARVWWADVVTPFLLETTTPVERDAKRPYWLARTLLELGDALEKLGRFDEARRAHSLVIERKLPYGEAIARGRLLQLGVEPAKVEL
ncbi:MAG: hypothetical protein Q8N18_14510 [Opitutaceae bacterium]|nr:hypothetical protein [Opitutaceae bacterium]